VEKNPKSNPKQYLKRQRTVKLPTDRYPLRIIWIIRFDTLSLKSFLIEA